MTEDSGARVAAFDIGSNTARGILARIVGDGTAQVLDEAQRMTALGRGLSGAGRIDAEGLAATVDFVASAVARWRPEQSWAVATAAARSATNASDLAQGLRERAGLELMVITGDEEARLAWRGAVAALDDVDVSTVVDIGGHSTKIVAAAGDHLATQSYQIGARSLTERYLRSDPPQPSELLQAGLRVVEVLGDAAEVVGASGTCVAVGGTAQSVLALTGDHTITADALAIMGIFARAAGSLTISTGGVREGLLLERTGARRLVR